MSASDWEVHSRNPDPERDALYLLRLEETGALAEAEALFDAIEAGEDLGPGLTADEVRAMLEQQRREENKG